MGIIRWDDHRPDDRGRRVTDDAGAGDDGRPDERCPESAQSLPDPRVAPRPACTPRLCRATFGRLRPRLAAFGHLPPSLARPQCSARVFAEPHPLGDPRRVASAPRAGPHRLTGRRLSVDRPGRRRGEGERTKPGRPALIRRTCPNLEVVTTRCEAAARDTVPEPGPVSYTHLTLPT